MIACSSTFPWFSEKNGSSSLTAKVLSRQEAKREIEHEAGSCHPVCEHRSDTESIPGLIHLLTTSPRDEKQPQNQSPGLDRRNTIEVH